MKHRFISLLLSAALVLFSAPVLPTQAVETDVIETTFAEPEYVPAFNLPEDIRAVRLSSDEALSTDDENLRDYSLIGINTLIFEAGAENAALFESSKQLGFNVYLEYDIGATLSSVNGGFCSDVDVLCGELNVFVAGAGADAVIFCGYGFENSTSAYDYYVSSGCGGGVKSWLSDANRYMISQAAQAVRRADNSVAVGLLASGETYNSNDFTDAESYVTDGLADFVLLDADCTIADADSPFESFVEDWAESCPVLVLQHNEKVFTQWGNRDEIVQQLVLIEKLDHVIGNAMNNGPLLFENRGMTTDSLRGYYRHELRLQNLSRELEITSPAQTEYSTSEDCVFFSGQYDDNFPLTINGTKVTSDGDGGFYLEYPLEAGENVLNVEYRDDIITYRITRTINIFKAGTLQPSSDMTIDGGVIVDISVYAYRDANIHAVLGGISVPLTESLTDDASSTSAYALYAARCSTPSGTIGRETPLGRVAVYGEYLGINQSLSGGAVTIAALPEPEEHRIITANDGLFSELSDNEPSFISAQETGILAEGSFKGESGTVVRVTADSAIIYDPLTTGKIPVPDYARLAAGTMDFLSKEVEYSEGGYYITKSGRRIRTRDAELLEESSLASSSVALVSAGMDDGNTVVTLSQTAPAPYNIGFEPFSYSSHECDWGNFFVDSFSPSTVLISFDYTVAAYGKVAMPENSMFTEAKWTTRTYGSDTKPCLELKLREGVKYTGVTVTRKGSNISFSFNGDEKSLSEMTIVIDPGHGWIAEGEFDPGAQGSFPEHGVYYDEFDVNLAIAKKLEQQLTALGATVIRYKTESEVYSTDRRSELARQYSPDLYLSIHSDAAKSKSVKGNSTYYFQPFSQPLAVKILNAVSQYYTNNVYGGVSDNMGASFDYFYVTTQQDFPSLLVEMGFITNWTDVCVLTSESGQTQLAAALVSAIREWAEQ